MMSLTSVFNLMLVGDRYPLVASAIGVMCPGVMWGICDQLLLCIDVSLPACDFSHIWSYSLAVPKSSPWERSLVSPEIKVDVPLSLMLERRTGLAFDIVECRVLALSYRSVAHPCF